MKKLVLAVLMSLLLVLTIPGSSLATPQRTVIADMDVVAVGRAPPFDPHAGEYTGTVYYLGEVTDAVRRFVRQSTDWKKLEGATASAWEIVEYEFDRYTGAIRSGTGRGEITITTAGPDHGVLVIGFDSMITGNIFSGPAYDVGNWRVISATKSLHQLKDATGTWTAGVVLVEIAPGVWTFVGTAHVAGDF